MEILDLRQIRSRDLDPLLDEENRLWHDQLLWDYSSSAEMIRRFVDARALPGYAAVEEGRPVGYSFFVYEDTKGLIGNLFVSRPFSGGTESELLTHVIETMQASPGVRRIEAQLMTFGSSSLDQTFRREHFRAYSRLFMMADLPTAAALPRRVLRDIDVMPWGEQHFDEAARVITQAYHGHIDSDINDQYRTVGGAIRFLRNIIQYPGCGTFFSPGSFITVRRPARTATGAVRSTPAAAQAQSVCGMVLTSVVHPEVGHVTQVCVTPAMHGAGVGYELMRHSIESFREAGFKGVSLTVTAANRRAVRLYERMGFRTLKEFSAYVWDAGARAA